MGDWLARNLPCNKCSSSDAVQESTYHFKCFSCGDTQLKKDSGETIKRVSMNKKEGLINCDYYEIKSRGITKETAAKYKIGAVKYSGVFGTGERKEYVNDSWAFVFNRVNGSELCTQKIRMFDDKKKMKVIGDGSRKELYGSWLFEPRNTNFVVVTEGEFDAAVVYQETGIASVSVNTGSSGALSEIKKNIDWLQKWQHIVLCFDNDEPGQKAVQQVLDSNVFDPGKVRVAQLIGKDANDMLLAGNSADLKKAIWNASTFSPPDIVLPEDCIDDVLTKPVEGMKMPWPSLHQALLGWRENTITTIGAADGIGKSEVVDEIIHELIFKEKEKVFLFSVEQEAGETVQRQAGKILNLPLHVPGTPFNDADIREAVTKLGDRLIIWKPDRAVTVDDFIAKMHYASVAYGVKVFILDHLKGLESQFNDSNKEMGRLLADLKTFAKSHKAAIVLISHVRKSSDDQLSFNKGRPPTKEDFYGSSALTAWSNTILSLSRNVDSDDPYESSILRIAILKNRLLGNRGHKRVFLQYINDTGRLIESAPPDYLGDDNE